jgi:hypothetical protein
MQYMSVARAVQRALAAAGVEFIDENGEGCTLVDSVRSQEHRKSELGAKFGAG